MNRIGVDNTLARLSDPRSTESERENCIEEIIRIIRESESIVGTKRDTIPIDKRIKLSSEMIGFCIQLIINKNDRNDLVERICQFIKEKMRNRNFSNRLLKESKLAELLALLLSSDVLSLRIKAGELMKPLVEWRNEANLNALAEYEKIHFKDDPSKTFPNLLSYLVIEAYEHSKISEACLALRGLLNGMPENCAKLNLEDFTRLLDIAAHQIKEKQLCFFQIVEALNRNADQANGPAQERVDIFWSELPTVLDNCHELLKSLTSKRPLELGEKNNREDDLRNLFLIYKNIFSFILTYKPSSLVRRSSVQARNYSLRENNTLDSFFKLRIDPANFLKQKQDATQALIMKQEMEKKNEDLRKDLENSSKKLDDLEKDNKHLREEIHRLEEKLVRAGRNSHIKQQFTNESLTGKSQGITTAITESPATRSEDENFLETSIAKGKCETKDEAKRFIQIIASKHDEEKTYRGLICGTLRNLSANLYTSPTHFLSEIIQNFEDNTYDQATKPWHLKVIINRDYLLFCNNEIGFTPKDVRSICSVSESTKTMGKHCGYKGIGFKSVYLCTDNPIVYSRPSWFFEFNRQVGEDEMAYITPRFIDYDDEFEPQSKYAILKSEIERNQDSNTFLFLPLRQKYSDVDDESKKYFEAIEAGIDENVLLFTKKLEKIVVDNRISDRVVEFSRRIETPDFIKACPEVAAFDSTIYVNHNNSLGTEISSKKLEYRVCQSKIHIPEWIAQEAGFSGHLMEIILAFPRTSLYEKGSFPVYSLLPIQDLGFKFLINCYWSVATSRESISEHSSMNRHLMKEVVSLFEKAASNDSQIRDNLQSYLPSPTSAMSPWWKSFVIDINNRLMPVLEDVLTGGHSNNKQLRLHSDLIISLIGEDYEKILEASEFKILQPTSINRSEKELESFGLKKFSMNDLIECMALENETISGWIDSRQNEWWERFFNLANKEKVKLTEKEKNIIKSARLFFKDGKRMALGTVQLGSVFFTLDQNMTIWFSKFSMVSFESQSEREFLVNTVGLQELTSRKLIGLILLKHIDASFESSDEIWRDLEYIKKHFDEYKSYIESEQSIAANSLCVPVMSDDDSQDRNPSYLPISFAILSSLFDYDITKLKLEKSCRNFNGKLVDFQSLKAIFKLSLYETFEWELFLIKLGCSLPTIDEQELIEKLANTDTSLPLFTPLESFDSRCVELACKLHEMLSSKSTELLQSLKYLPINAVNKANPSQNIYPISGVAINSMFQGHLPSIEVPDHAIRLAEKLGVLTRPNAATCFEILKNLASNKCIEAKSYIEWFLQLNSYTSNLNDLEYPRQKMICLENFFGENDFYSPSDVYFCTESSEIRLICSHLGKTLVNSNKNNDFRLIESILMSLGSQTTPSLRDIIECMCKMTNDKTLFMNQNTQSYLTQSARQDFQELYMFLEARLKEIFPLDDKYAMLDPLKLELQERAEIVSQIQAQIELFISASDDIKLEELDFPIMTDEYKIERTRNLSSERVVACFHTDLLNDKNDKYSYDKLYFDVTIASLCPRVMALLKADYMDATVSVEVIQDGKIYENSSFTKIFRDALNNQDVEVFQQDSLNLKLVSKPHKPKWLNSVNYAIIHKKYILFKKTKFAAYDDLYKLLLEFAIQSFNRSMTKKQIEEKVQEYMRQIQNLPNKAFTEVKEKPKISNGKLSDLICDMSETNAIQSKKVFSHVGSAQLRLTSLPNQINEPKPSIKAEYKDILEKYNRRVQKSSQIPTYNRARRKLVGLENRTKIPLTPLKTRAELFFSSYLKSKYPKSYVEKENWISRARQECYDHFEEHFDDSLGWAFKIKDSQSFFTKSHTKTCLIEVKPTGEDWDGTFRLSKNELEQIKNIDKVKFAFVVVIIENVENPNQIQIAKIVDLTDENLESSSSKIEGKRIELEPESYVATVKDDEGFFEDDGHSSRVGENLADSYEINEYRSQASDCSDKKPPETSSQSNTSPFVSDLVISQANSTVQPEIFDSKNRPTVLLGVVESHTEKLFYESVFDQLNAFGRSPNTDFNKKYKLSDLVLFCAINPIELNPSVEISKEEKTAYDDLIANFKNHLRYESKSNSFKIMLLEKLIREYEFKRAEYDASNIKTIYSIQRNEICHLLNIFKYSPMSEALSGHQNQSIKVIGVMNGYNFVKETQKPRCVYTSRYSIENYVFDPLNLFHVITEFEAYWRQITAKLEKQIYEKTKNIYQNLKKMPNALDSQTLNLYLKSITNILRKDTEDSTIQTIKFIHPVEVSLDFENWLLEIDNLELYRRFHNLTCTRPNSCILGLENGNSVSSCFFSQMHEKYCPTPTCLLKSKSKSKSNGKEDACFLNLYKEDFIQKQDSPLLLQEIVRRAAQDLLNYYNKNACILFIPEDLLLEFKEAPERRLPQIPSRFHDLVRKNRRSKFDEFRKMLEKDENNPFMPSKFLDQTPLHLLVWLGRNDIILEMYNQYATDSGQLAKWRTDRNLKSTMRCLKDDFGASFCKELKQYLKLRTDQDDLSEIDEATDDEIKTEDSAKEHDTTFALRFFEKQLEKVVVELKIDIYFNDVNFDDIFKDSIDEEILFITDD